MRVRPLGPTNSNLPWLPNKRSKYDYYGLATALNTHCNFGNIVRMKTKTIKMDIASEISSSQSHCVWDKIWSPNWTPVASTENLTPIKIFNCLGIKNVLCRFVIKIWIVLNNFGGEHRIYLFRVFGCFSH